MKRLEGKIAKSTVVGHLQTAPTGFPKEKMGTQTLEKMLALGHALICFGVGGPSFGRVEVSLKGMGEGNG